MGTRHDIYDAICVPLEDVTDVANLTATDDATVPSAYSESTPRPGLAVRQQTKSKLVPVVSGAQTADVRVKCTRAGNPDLSDRGVEIGYRFESEANDQYRYWAPPNIITGWNSPYFDTGAVGSAACVVEGTGELVLCYDSDKNSTLDPLTLAWTAHDTCPAAATACVALPGKRVLAMTLTVSYYSDDAGETWSIYSHHPLPTTGAPGEAGMEYLRGDIVFFLRTGTSSDDVDQYASSDLGATFQLVENSGTILSTASYAGPKTCVCQGRIIVAYQRDTDSYPAYRVLSSAWDPLSGATESTVRASACNEVAIAATPDGILYYFIRESTSAITLFMSYDLGETWEEVQNEVYFSGSAADYLVRLQAHVLGGYVVLLHRNVASTASFDNAIGALILGGWSNLPSDYYTTAADKGSQFGRLAWGIDNSGLSDQTATWIPIELPNNTTVWTQSGTAGALAAPGEMTISTSAAVGKYYMDIGAFDSGTFLFQLREDSGGTTADMSIGIHMILADGTDDYDIELRVSSTTLRIYDNNASATVNDITIDSSANFQLFVRFDGGGVSATAVVGYRPTTNVPFTLTTTGAISSDQATPAATGTLEWGNVDSGTAASGWQLVAYHMGQPNSIASEFNGVGLTDGTEHPPSRPMTSTPVQVPDLGVSGGTLGHLAAHGGPGTFEEIWKVPARHDYGLANVFAAASPSPDSTWRTDGAAGTQVDLVYDLTKGLPIGSAIAVLCAGANFRQFRLDGWNGSSYDQIGSTADLATGFTSLSYTLTGATLIPAAGSSTAGRYLWEHELAGGHVVFDPGGTELARRIVGNTAGLWAGSGVTTAKPVIHLDPSQITGAESGTGTVHLVAPGGLLIAHPTSAAIYRYIRVRITGTQPSPEAYHEAGIILPMALRALGAEPGWGGGEDMTPNVLQQRNRYGTTRVRQLGPPGRAWTWTLVDGESHRALRDAADPDYLGSSGGVPNIAQEDTAFLLQGLLQKTKSGEIPVVAIRNVPSSNGTLTDPTRWLYGRMVGGVRIDWSGGEWGTDEDVRVPSIVIEEIT